MKFFPDLGLSSSPDCGVLLLLLLLLLLRPMLILRSTCHVTTCDTAARGHHHHHHTTTTTTHQAPGYPGVGQHQAAHHACPRCQQSYYSDTNIIAVSLLVCSPSLGLTRVRKYLSTAAGEQLSTSRPRLLV